MKRAKAKVVDYARRYVVVFDTEELRAQLQKIADADRRSLNFTINRALEEFIRAQTGKRWDLQEKP